MAHCASHPVTRNFLLRQRAQPGNRLTNFSCVHPRRRRAVDNPTRILGGTFGSPPDPAFWDRNSPADRGRNLAGLKNLFRLRRSRDLWFRTGATALDKILTFPPHSPRSAIYPGRHDWPYFAEHASLASAAISLENFFAHHTFLSYSAYCLLLRWSTTAFLVPGALCAALLLAATLRAAERQRVHTTRTLSSLSASPL